MYRIHPDDLVKTRFMYFWALLTFQAGFLNSIGFLACQRFVSHITGFGTQSGVVAAHGDYIFAIKALSAPASFILGAWTAGLFTEVRQTRNLPPRYDLVVYSISGFLAVLLTLGTLGLFGDFGEPLLTTRDYLFLSALSYICGMQNACFSRMTNGQVRTTHLTGLSTDLGTDMALLQWGSLSPEERVATGKKNLLRGITFLAFVMGAVISAFVDRYIGFWSLAVPLSTSLVVTGIFVVTQRKLNKKQEPPVSMARAQGA